MIGNFTFAIVAFVLVASAASEDQFGLFVAFLVSVALIIGVAYGLTTGLPQW